MALTPAEVNRKIEDVYVRNPLDYFWDLPAQIKALIDRGYSFGLLNKFFILLPKPSFFFSLLPFCSFSLAGLAVALGVPLPTILSAAAQGFSLPDEIETKREAKPPGTKRAEPADSTTRTGLMPSDGLAKVPPSLKGLVISLKLTLTLPVALVPRPPLGLV